MNDLDRWGTTLEADAPLFPMPRASGCPFDPPPVGLAAQKRERFSRVKLWNGKTYWLITHHADQRTLLADPRLSADVRKPGYPIQAGVAGAAEGGAGEPAGSEASPEHGAESDAPVGFVLMDDPEHARLRRLVTAPFAIKRIEAMRPTVQRITDDLIDQMLAGPKPVDLVEAFALPLPSLVISDLLGVPYEDHEFFQNHTKAIINRSSDPATVGASFQALGQFLGGLLAQKMAAPQNDLLSELGRHVQEGELPLSEAVKMGVLLLIGGHETTANMIALGTLALLEHPDQLALLRDGDDPSLVVSAVEELLRYLSVVHDGRRRAVLEDIELDGHVFKAGEGLIFPNDLGNRDPDVFENPDELDLTRDARQHVAFGFGVHQCLGQPLARMELQVVYSTLYKRIPTLALATELEQIPFKHEGTVYGVYELPLTW